MNEKLALIRELDDLPEPVLLEVLDFVRFLKTKTQEKHLESTLLSETSLRKEWLRPEEDEAWSNV